MSVPRAPEPPAGAEQQDAKGFCQRSPHSRVRWGRPRSAQTRPFQESGAAGRRALAKARCSEVAEVTHSARLANDVSSQCNAERLLHAGCCGRPSHAGPRNEHCRDFEV